MTKHFNGLGARMRLALTLAAAAFAMVAFATAGSAATNGAPAACATGDAASAAVTLYGTGSEIAGTDEIAGFTTALALEPRIYPGTRHRMIKAGDRWCDATTGFNEAWQASGRSFGDGRAVAEAYASLAAAPYFDGVTVTGTEAGAAGTWTVATHALTNGVDARWTVVTDAAGVKSAAWTATAFAQKPLEAEWEGLTALPGLTERYVRTADGLLDDVRGLPSPETAAAASDDDGSPGLLQHTFADGYTIVTSIGDAHVGIDTGVNTGIDRADVLRTTMRVSRENYEEFLSWGLSKGWRALPGFSDEVGYVYVNDALGLACLACVFISDDFQIHMNSEVQTALDLLGYTGYRDRAQAYSLIIGHEMFHNFQNRYNKPGHFNQAGRSTPASYSEGTARFQETLHTYAGTSFAANTLVTAQNANGCNGFDTGGSMDAGMAAGPFGKTYNTCFLWGPWYVKYGQQAFLNLVREGVPAHSPKPNGIADIGAAMEQAAAKPLATQLAQFAGSVITNRGRSWTTWSGTDSLDWGSLIEGWTPRQAAPGTEITRSLGAGGVMGVEIIEDARVNLEAGSDTLLYLLRDDGTKVKARAINGHSVAVGKPQQGERLYVLVVRPVAGAELATLKVEAPGPAPKPSDVVLPAQAPVTGQVLTLAPSAGELGRNSLTSAYLVFTVPVGVDNAKGEVVATYPLPGDVDLFLQRQNANGTWSDTGSSGESGSLTGESMVFGRLPAGAYRIEVHNWAGPAGNPVSLKATFYNSAGQIGA